MMSLNVVADSENADRIFLNDVDISASCQIFSSFLRYGQLGTQPSAFSPFSADHLLCCEIESLSEGTPGCASRCG